MQYDALAAAYDALMSDIDYEGWADYIASLLGGARRIGEAACGTGALTLRLSRRGYSVTASDISPAMVARAQSNMHSLGARANFVVQDMRRLDMPRRDAIISACDGVNYLLSEADALAFFSAARRSLVPGGLLAFDISSAKKLCAAAGSCCFDDRDELSCIWSYAQRGVLIDIDLTLFLREGELFRRADERQTQRIWQTGELSAILAKAGFCDIMTYDFPTLAPATAVSERVQFTARSIN